MIDNIILIILIVIVVYYIQKNDSDEKFNNNDKESKQIINQKILPNLQNNKEIIKKQNKKKSKKCVDHIELNQQNLHFVDLKYHTEYTDVLTAINDMAPNQKRVFNLMCMPVIEMKVNDYETNKLVKEFIEEFNIFLNNVQDSRIANTGWDEKIEDPKIQSGWDKFRNNLGLSHSLYEKNNNTEKKVKLINFDEVKKVATTNEIRYTMKLILQKIGVNDQIVLSLSLVSSKNSKKIIIEDFSVIGFLSDQTLYNGLTYTSFGNLDDGNFVKDSDIISELIRKDRERIKKSIMRNAITDNFD